MLYNKLYGLEFMKGALKGVKGATVLPWRVYHSPDEFKPEHFPNAPRLLIRTNFPGNSTEVTHIVLPRSEICRRSNGKMLPRVKMREMIRYYPTAPPQFIVHGVEPRSAYPLSIELRNSKGKIAIIVQATDSQSTIWKVSGRAVVVADNFKEAYADLVEHGKMSEKDATKLVGNLKCAYKAMLKKLRKDGHELKRVEFETSAALRIDKPTEPEFYDFLIKKTNVKTKPK